MKTLYVAMHTAIDAEFFTEYHRYHCEGRHE
jgi:hypothetical protein